jgi:hypothetical protein
MTKSRGPLIALIAIVGIAVSLTVRELLVHQISVRTADGTSVTIETDPNRLAAVKAARPLESIQRGGIEPNAKDKDELPEGTGREANLSGTKVR